MKSKSRKTKILGITFPQDPPWSGWPAVYISLQQLFSQLNHPFMWSKSSVPPTEAQETLP